MRYGMCVCVVGRQRVKCLPGCDVTYSLTGRYQLLGSEIFRIVQHLQTHVKWEMG